MLKIKFLFNKSFYCWILHSPTATGYFLVSNKQYFKTLFGDLTEKDFTESKDLLAVNNKFLSLKQWFYIDKLAQTPSVRATKVEYYFNKHFCAVVAAQLVEWSLTTTRIRGSIPLIGKLYVT